MARATSLPIVAVLGPTAAGKTALGVALAERLAGEIVTCDSQQVYVGMDIGTGKAMAGERARVPHHLLDVVQPDEGFSAARWAKLAAGVVRDIAGRGRVPVIVGGTGLYYRALVRGLFAAPPADAAIRERHQREAETAGTPALHARLATVDPEAAANIRTADLVRISRALEVWEQTGETMTALRARTTTPPLRVRPFAILLDPPLSVLRPRIQARVDAMVAAGFLDEVRALRAAGFGASRALGSLGYAQFGRHLDGGATFDEALDDTKRATVAFARRQRTWFRSETIDVRVAGEPDANTLAVAARAALSQSG